MSPQAIIWAVAAVATAGVTIRPFDWPEAVWAVTGAALLVVAGLLSPREALAGVASGADQQKISAVVFLKLGFLAMPPGLVLALAGALLRG